MRKLIIMSFTLVIFSLSVGWTAAAKEGSGELLFKKHCATCHPNISKLKSAKNIVTRMRNPLPFMPTFDEAKISNEDAKEIEIYVLNPVRGSGNVKAATSKRPAAASGQ